MLQLCPSRSCGRSRSDRGGDAGGRYIGARGSTRPSAAIARAGLALVLAALVAVLFVAAPEALLRSSSDPRVLELARPLLALGAFFRVVDAVGIIAGGSLRSGRHALAVRGRPRWPGRCGCQPYVFAIWLQGGSAPGWASSCTSSRSGSRWCCVSAPATGGPCASKRARIGR
jgi:hypothetical protein